MAEGHGYSLVHNIRIQRMCNIMCNIVWENTILRNTHFLSHVIFRFLLFSVENFCHLKTKNNGSFKSYTWFLFFLEKNDQKLPYFKGKKFEIVRFRLWIIGACHQNIASFKNKFYFHV